MDTQFWWVFDALVVFLLVWVIYSNAKRGFSKVFIICIGYLVAAVASSLLSGVAASPLYEVVARRSNIEAIEQVNDTVSIVECFTETLNDKNYGIHFDARIIEDYLREEGGSFDQNIYNYVNKRAGYVVATPQEFKQLLNNSFVEEYGRELNAKLPYYAAADFSTKMETNPHMLNSVVKQLTDRTHSKRENAEFIEDNFSREPTTEAFRIFVYFVIFSVLMAITTLIYSMNENNIFINLRSATEHVLGGMIGLVEAGILIMLMTFAVRLLVLIGGGRLLCFNEPTIKMTWVFHFIYDKLALLL